MINFGRFARESKTPGDGAWNGALAKTLISSSLWSGDGGGKYIENLIFRNY